MCAFLSTWKHCMRACAVCSRDWISGCSPDDFTIYVCHYNGQLQICELCRSKWNRWRKKTSSRNHAQLEFHGISNSSSTSTFIFHSLFHHSRISLNRRIFFDLAHTHTHRTDAGKKSWTTALQFFITLFRNGELCHLTLELLQAISMQGNWTITN